MKKLHLILFAAFVAIVLGYIPAGCSGGTISGGGGSPGSYIPGSNPENATVDEQEILRLVNEERAFAGVAPLDWCDALYDVAKAHSNDMDDRDFFAHTNPDGQNPSDRGRDGYAGAYTFRPLVPDAYEWGIGENIAWGQPTPAAVMTAWMNSPGHRDNILNSTYTHIGVGQCDGDGVHWTQNFGTR